MKRRNTLTAVLFLAFLAVGFWLLASAFIQGGALREQFGLVRRDLSQLPAFLDGGAETAANEDLDRDHGFIQLFGGFQRLLGRRVVEDVSGSNHVALLDDGALNFVALGAQPADCSGNGEKAAAFQQTLTARGIPSLYVVAPQKLRRNTDLLPIGMHNYGNEAADSLLAALDAADTDYLDLRPFFEATEDYASWFFRTDHHWKPEAGFFTWQILAQELEERLGYATPAELTAPESWDTQVLEDFFLGSQGKRVGTLYAGTDDFTLYIPRFDTDLTYSCPSYPFERTGPFSTSVCFPERVAQRDLFGGNPYTYYSGGDYPLAAVTNHKNPDGPSILLLRESFSCAVAPFLALSCSQQTTVDLRYFQGDLMETVEQLQPDLVLILYNASSSGVESLFRFGGSVEE